MKNYNFLESGAVKTDTTVFTPKFIELFSSQIPNQLCNYIVNEKYHKKLFKKIIFSFDHRAYTGSDSIIVRQGEYYYIPMKISSRKHPLHIASCCVVWKALSNDPVDDLDSQNVQLKLYVNDENKRQLNSVLPEIMRSIIY